MNIAFKEFNNALYISVSGELDEATSKATRETLDALIDETKVARVVLDMSELSFMDSTGIGVLLGRFKKLKARSIPLSIANPSKAVDKLMNLAGLYSYMPKVVY